MNSFKSVKDIIVHVGDERLQLSEFYLERSNLLGLKEISDQCAVPCMIEYLEENQVYYQQPISFDEASFLIWMNELKKEYQNGHY